MIVTEFVEGETLRQRLAHTALALNEALSVAIQITDALSAAHKAGITFDHGRNWIHTFSPDGDKIVFAGERNGVWNVYWVSRSTKQQEQLTNYTKLNAYVRYPAWSPLGNQIVYEYAETTGNIWLMELK